MKDTTNILSIDVEEWFHYEYFLRHNPPHTPLLNKVIPALLHLLEKHDTRATFFCVGEVARDQPEIIEEIRAAGHEIGSHSFAHKPLWEFADKNAIEKDLLQSMLIIKKLAGKSPRGYRAPYFSIDKRNPWMIDMLESLGFKYDASIFPRKTPLYGAPEAPLAKYRPSKQDIFSHDPQRQFWEYPMTVFGIGRVPFSGGFYLRSMPLALVKLMLRHVNRKGRQGIVYFHPWEMHAALPPAHGLKMTERFIASVGVKGLAKKLDSLLNSFKFGAFEDDLEREQ